MKLFIFKPHENWSYCGGGRVVIAEDYEAAISNFPKDKFYKSDEDETEDMPNDVWTLIEVFEIGCETPRIVLDDYNWA